jgi:hypothetical protein
MRTLFILATMLLLTLTANAQIQIAAEFPKASIAGKSSGEVTIDEIIKAGELLTNNNELKVKSFSLTFKLDGDLVTTTSKSNKITDKMTGYLKQLTPGQKLYFEDIETTKADGAVIKLQPVWFIIK